MAMHATTTRSLDRAFDALSAASYTVGIMLVLSSTPLLASDTAQAAFAAWTLVLMSANWDTST